MAYRCYIIISFLLIIFANIAYNISAEQDGDECPLYSPNEFELKAIKDFKNNEGNFESAPSRLAKLKGLKSYQYPEQDLQLPEKDRSWLVYVDENTGIYRVTFLFDNEYQTKSEIHCKLKCGKLVDNCSVLK